MFNASRYAAIPFCLGMLVVASCNGHKDNLRTMLEASQKAVVTVKTENAVGSGFLVGSDGLIVTNSHVVEGSTSFEVVLSSGQTRVANLIRSGIVPLDIAVLRIGGGRYPHIKWADSARCAIGEEVYAIGSPLALSSTVTKGIVSNCSRDLKGITLIQTDAAINAGSSGGPLVNAQGEALGILTMKVVDKGIEGLNFAIASNVVQEFLEDRTTNLEMESRSDIDEQNEDRSSESSTRSNVEGEKLPTPVQELTGTGISGTITDSDGKRVRNARVFAYSNSQMAERPKYFSEETGVDGRYVLPLPEGGTYYLVARNRFGAQPQMGELYGRYDRGIGEPSAINIKNNEIIRNVDISVGKIW